MRRVLSQTRSLTRLFAHSLVRALNCLPTRLIAHSLTPPGALRHTPQVSMVTQCATLPGQTFTYRFKAEPAGTHMWHAHHGVERGDGLFGALIVREKKPSPVVRRGERET